MYFSFQQSWLYNLNKQFSDEKCTFQGVLRQIPLVGSMINWFSPVQASVKGKTFNLAEGIDLYSL